MHVIFVAPHFPANQRNFVQALKAVGARVTGIGDAPHEAIGDFLRSALDDYVAIPNVTDPVVLTKAVKLVQSRGWVDRLEAVIEAHMEAAAQAREACTIPGLSVQQVEACRDKALMKDLLRKAGVPCAQSAAVDSLDEAMDFVKGVGFPVILKMRAGAGAAGTYRADNAEELARAARALHLDRGGSAAIEEFIEGHEGFFDTLLTGDQVAYEGISHYFPNVLTAMRDRRHNPMILSTNQVETNATYDEVRQLGRKVINALGLQACATHMEWFFGPKGLKFSEIGARPPGVCFWDVYNAGNDMDLYLAWAEMLVHGQPRQRASRRFASGLMALRPERDGRISGYSGVDRMQEKYGELVVKAHLPPPGTPTQGIEAGYMANAWLMLRHPDFDTLKGIMSEIGDTVRVHAS